MWVSHPECDLTYFKLSSEGITSAAVKGIHSAPHIQAGVLCQSVSVMEASCRAQDLHGVLCPNDNHPTTPPRSHQFSSHLLLLPLWTNTFHSPFHTQLPLFSLFPNSLLLPLPVSTSPPVLSLTTVLPIWSRRDVVKVFGEFLLTKPTLPGRCLSSTWNGSTQIRLGF